MSMVNNDKNRAILLFTAAIVNLFGGAAFGAYPTLAKVCGPASSIENRAMAVDDVIRELQIQVSPGLQEKSKLRTIVPIKGKSFLNNYASELRNKYGASLVIRLETCGSGSANIADISDLKMFLTAAEIAGLRDNNPDVIATLRHEESHIANSNPKFGIAKSSQFLNLVSFHDKGPIAIPPYTNGFVVDEISSYITELGWSYSEEARHFSESDLRPIRIQAWIYLRNLSNAFCNGLAKLASHKLLLGFDRLAPSAGDFVLTGSVDSPSMSGGLLLLQTGPYRGTSEIGLAALVNDGFQITFPLFDHGRTDMLQYQSENRVGPPNSPIEFSAGLKKLIGDIQTSMASGERLCTGITSAMAKVPETDVSPGNGVEVKIIQGSEPELRTIAPILMKIQSDARLGR